jgi:hypothetical protein
MRVEGGPALADFQGLIETLNRSLIQTRDQPAGCVRAYLQQSVACS